MATFDPSRSRVNESQLSDFINSEISGDLKEVPGVGDVTIRLLRNCNTVLEGGPGDIRIQGITDTHGLISVFLAFKNGVDEDGNARKVGPVEHAQRFFDWLTHIGAPAGYRSAIVDSIGRKVNVSFPGIYDPAVYGGEEA